MANSANLELARAYFERILNEGDMAEADRVFAPTLQFHYPMGDLEGAKAVKDYVAAVRAAFPDIKFSIEDLFGDQSRLAVRWSLTGTQSGPFRGEKPTGRVVTVTGNTIFRTNEDTIEEIWIAFDPGKLVGD